MIRLTHDEILGKSANPYVRRFLIHVCSRKGLKVNPMDTPLWENEKLLEIELIINGVEVNPVSYIEWLTEIYDDEVDSEVAAKLDGRINNIYSSLINKIDGAFDAFRDEHDTKE